MNTYVFRQDPANPRLYSITGGPREEHGISYERAGRKWRAYRQLGHEVAWEGPHDGAMWHTVGIGYWSDLTGSTFDSVVCLASGKQEAVGRAAGILNPSPTQRLGVICVSPFRPFICE